MTTPGTGTASITTMLRLYSILLLCAYSLCACANQSVATTVPTDSHYQIIIRFRAPIADPANPVFVKRLSASAGTGLQFVRTLAVGAQLYSVTGSLSRAELAAVLRSLGRRHDVLYAEEDRRVHPGISK